MLESHAHLVLSSHTQRPCSHNVEFWVIQLSKVTEKLGLLRSMSSKIERNSKPKQERAQTCSA